jgi:hypothetical protein
MEAEDSIDLTTTTWTNIQITRATTINGLKSATPKVIWTDSTASRCCNIWAPEIHWSFNKWHMCVSLPFSLFLSSSDCCGRTAATTPPVLPARSTTSAFTSSRAPQLISGGRPGPTSPALPSPTGTCGRSTRRSCSSAVRPTSFTAPGMAATSVCGSRTILYPLGTEEGEG